MLYMYACINTNVHTYQCVYIHTGWRRLIGSPKLQINFHKRASKYRALLLKMTYKDKGSYESSPPCIIRIYIYTYIHIHIYTYIHIYIYTHIHIFVMCSESSKQQSCDPSPKARSRVGCLVRILKSQLATRRTMRKELCCGLLRISQKSARCYLHCFVLSKWLCC